jgi:hypothetical protein
VGFHFGKALVPRVASGEGAALNFHFVRVGKGRFDLGDPFTGI